MDANKHVPNTLFVFDKYVIKIVVISLSGASLNTLEMTALSFLNDNLNKEKIN